MIAVKSKSHQRGTENLMQSKIAVIVVDDMNFCIMVLA